MNHRNSTTKKVLVIGPIPPPYGGIATVIDSIINSELREDYSFEIFNRSESVYDWDKSPFQNKILKIKRAGSLLKNLWSGEYCLIHLHGSTSGFFGDTLVMLLAFVTGSKVLLHLHGTDWESFYGSASLFRRIYARIGLSIPYRIVVLYELWARNIREIKPGTNVRVIRNFIPDCPKPSKKLLDDLREKLGISDDEFVISSIGRVGRRKGSFDIVKATTQMLQETKEFRILLVGGEENKGEMDSLKKAVEDSQLSNWIILTDEVNVEDVPIFLGISDVFVLPSYREGMPMSIIEAMRSGKPVVATTVGGIPDMIETGVSGILVDPGAPNEIALAILKLKNDESLRRNLGIGARKAFEAGFETSRVVREIRRIYEEMITE